MTSKPGALPSDLASAYMALLAHLELRIEKLKRELYGQRSERTARLIEQLELELEELVTTASEDELAAQGRGGESAESPRLHAQEGGRHRGAQRVGRRSKLSEWLRPKPPVSRQLGMASRAMVADDFLRKPRAR